MPIRNTKKALRRKGQLLHAIGELLQAEAISLVLVVASLLKHRYVVEPHAHNRQTGQVRHENELQQFET